MDKATRSWKTTKTIFQLQGNIASGKSELLTILQDKGISVAKEPLEEWAELLKISEKEGGKDFSVHKQTRILSSLSLRDSETRQTLVSKDKVVMERDIVSSKEIFVPYATGNNRMDKEGETTIRLLHKNLPERDEVLDGVSLTGGSGSARIRGTLKRVYSAEGVTEGPPC